MPPKTATVAEPEAAPSAQTAELTALVAGLAEQVAALTAEVAASKSATPQFVPMDKMLNPVLAQDLNRARQLKPGEVDMVPQHSIPSDQFSRPARRPPTFTPGGRVRLALEKLSGSHSQKRARARDEDGNPVLDEEGNPVYERQFRELTWGEVCARLGWVPCPTVENRLPCQLGRVKVGEVCPGCGHGPEILSLDHLRTDGQWQYRVRVPGLTGVYGDGLTESALEPAR